MYLLSAIQTRVNLWSMFDEARGLCGNVKWEVVAGWLGIPPSQLSQQLGGTGHVSLSRVMALSEHDDPDAREFGAVLMGLINKRTGYTEADPLMVACGQLMRAMGDMFSQLQFRMAKIECPEQQQKRSA